MSFRVHFANKAAMTMIASVTQDDNYKVSVAERDSLHFIFFY